MKLYIIFMAMTLVASCGNKSSGEESSGGGAIQDDSTISGTVSTIWQNLTISSAHAQFEMIQMGKGGMQMPQLPLILTPEELHEQNSVSLLSSEPLRDVATDSDLASAVSGYLSEIESYTTFDGSTEKITISDIPVSAPYGIVVAYGFDSNKLLISLTSSALASDLSYKIKDSKEADVSFYKLIFLFDKENELQYRQSYVFMDGSKQKLNVDFLTSAASVKITEDLYNNSSLSVSDLKANLISYKEEVRTVQTSEIERVKSYLGTVYLDGISNIADRTIAISSMLSVVKSQPSLLDSMNLSVDRAQDQTLEEAEVVLSRLSDANLISYKQPAPVIGNELVKFQVQQKGGWDSL